MASGGVDIEFQIKTYPNSKVQLIFINPGSGTRSSSSPKPGTTDADGNVTLSMTVSTYVTRDGELATLEVTVTLPDGSKVIENFPYMVCKDKCPAEAPPLTPLGS